MRVSMIRATEKFFERLTGRSAPYPSLFDPLLGPKHYAVLHPPRGMRSYAALWPLCPDLCLPPNLTKCYRVLGQRWKALLDVAFVALSRNSSCSMQVC